LPPQVSTEECRLLRDVDVSVAQELIIGLTRGELADDATILVYEMCVAID
jgi:hypothetical protein